MPSARKDDLKVLGTSNSMVLAMPSSVLFRISAFPLDFGEYEAVISCTIPRSLEPTYAYSTLILATSFKCELFYFVSAKNVNDDGLLFVVFSFVSIICLTASASLSLE